MKKATTEKNKEPELTGFAHELDFWVRFVESDRFKTKWASDEPNPELREPAGEIITQYAGKAGKVLDVGSGAESILRGTIPRRWITAVDPLADEYRKIYRDCKVKKGSAENLSAFGQFDVVHISNALDHCQDPLLAMASLWAACKPGGLVYIQGFAHEADWHNRAGLHQWNIDLHTDRLVIDGTSRLVYRPEKLVFASKEESRWKKNGEPVKWWLHFAFEKTGIDEPK